MSDAAFHCMKTSAKKLLPLTLIGIALTSLFSVQPAQAFMVRLEQVGANVVANGSGAVNLTGLTFASGGFSIDAVMLPSSAVIIAAQTPQGRNSISYTGFSGPSSFGPGSALIHASSSHGASV